MLAIGRVQLPSTGESLIFLDVPDDQKPGIAADFDAALSMRPQDGVPDNTDLVLFLDRAAAVSARTHARAPLPHLARLPQVHPTNSCGASLTASLLRS